MTKMELNKGVRAMLKRRTPQNNSKFLDFNFDRVVQLFKRVYSIKIILQLSVMNKQ